VDDHDFVLLAGSASRKLAHAIAAYLDHSLCEGETLRFSEGNLFVRVPENVRERDVFLVQGTAFPANDNFVELLFWIDALKRASAASVSVVMPYFSYAKGDKKDEPRVSIRARVCADAIEAAGADRVITMDLHAPQVQGFFRIPVDDLYALPVLCESIQSKPPQPRRRLARRRVRQKGEALRPAPRRPACHRRQGARRPLRERPGRRPHRRGRGPHGPDRRRLHDLGRHAGRGRPRAEGSGRDVGVRRGQPRPARRQGDRTHRRQPHRAPVHD